MVSRKKTKRPYFRRLVGVLLLFCLTYLISPYILEKDKRVHARSGDTIRVMTWNIFCDGDRGSVCNNNWNLRKEIVGDILRDVSPDIVVFQETRDDAEEFLESVLREHSRYIKVSMTNSPYDATVMFLIQPRFELMDVHSGSKVENLSPDDVFHEWRSSFGVDVYDNFTNTTYAVLASHFPTFNRPLPRSHALAGLIEISKLSASPKISLGDYNAWPWGRMWDTLEEHGLIGSGSDKSILGLFPITWHFNGIRLPGLSMDRILTSSELSVKQYCVVRDIKASDHFAVLADLSLSSQ